MTIVLFPRGAPVMVRIPPELCTRCKGYKKLCGLPSCPILDRLRSQATALARARWERRIGGSTPPAVLVGEAGYPRATLYYMVPPGIEGPEAGAYEDPQGWSEKSVPLDMIIRLRSSLVSGSLKWDVKRPLDLTYSMEVGLAAVSLRPVESEVELERLPLPKVRFDGFTSPLGPTAPASSLRISGSPLLAKKMESMIWDDVKAEVGVRELWRSGLDVYRIQRALSLGMLGRLRRRRLVPTRWAITAVDEILSRYFRERLRTAKEISDLEVYYREYLGNRFLIIMKPGPGWFEWVELWHPMGLWTGGATKVTVWRLTEDPMGRRTADDGGFSAAKEAVLEHLAKRGRRADVIIVREILPTYYAPVGNWHIRETVKRALQEGFVDKALSPQELEALASKRIESWGKAKGRLMLLKDRITLERFW